MTDIPPELPPTGGVAPQGQPQQSLTPTADAMQQGVQDAVGDFMTTLVRLVESKGLNLDDIMSNETSVQDQSDLAQGDADPAEFLTEEELILLVEKFEAMDPQSKQKIEQELISQLDPRFVERLRAVQRFVQSRQGNAQQTQQAPPVPNAPSTPVV